jgi:hypothetical protein
VPGMRNLPAAPSLDLAPPCADAEAVAQASIALAHAVSQQGRAGQGRHPRTHT